jgi:ABC-type oligopeptide transport system substrate-binding subunit
MGRRLALLVLAGLLAGCGSSAPKPPPRGGPTLRLAIVTAPRTLDPARAADLVSLNVAHELYAGLTRIAGRGVAPDLAESWKPSEGGLVWTFRLRKGIRWSDGKQITADDFRRAWLRALDPRTGSAYARAEMQNIRGARRYHAAGSGPVGVEALDDRTLRVTLQHPVPWLDEQVAYPVFFPARRGRAWSGPFRLASERTDRLVLERNRSYWDAANVKPRRVVLTTSTRRVDAVLPRGLAAPGFPWIETATPPTGPGWRSLPTLSVHLLWFVTRRQALSDATRRAALAGALRSRELDTVVPPAMPAYSSVAPLGHSTPTVARLPPLRLTLAYTTEDPRAEQLANGIRRDLEAANATVRLEGLPSLRALVRASGPPARPGIDLVLLGWSAEYFDAYNILDLFPCASALNVAQWCDRSYDALMRRAVRTLDDNARYRIERRIVEKLDAAVPAVPLFAETEHVFLRRGVHGFRWSPLGFYELMGMTRS